MQQTSPTARLCAATAVALFVCTSPVHAAPPREQAPAEPDTLAEQSAIIDEAIDAWRSGDWTEVRDLLEPLLRNADEIADPVLREQALRYLTEATLYDEGLDEADREALARGYVERLLESAVDWAPPSGLHGRAFYDLVAQVRAERDASKAAACEGELLSCEADLGELRVDHRDLLRRHATLDRQYREQRVVVTESIQRNRGVALLPFGVGHFAEGNYVLAGSFLGLEVATGVAALSLLIYRSTTLGCSRTAAFTFNSLVCDPGVDVNQQRRFEDIAVRVRSAETALAWTFVGLVVADIVVAQALFKPTRPGRSRSVPRDDLEDEGIDIDELETQADEDEASEGRRRPRRGSPDEGEEGSAKLEIRPIPVFLPGGAGLGVALRF